MQIFSLAYHAASGNLVLGRLDGALIFWQTDPQIAPAPQAAVAQAAVAQAAVTPAPSASIAPAPQAAVAPAQSAAPQAVFKFGDQAASKTVFNFTAGLQSAPQAAASTSPLFNFSGALQAALPDHACVRERLAAAQTQANDIQASIDKADKGLRQQMSREQELKHSIADLEAKCAYICSHVFHAS